MPVWGYEFWVEEGADEEAEQRVEIIIRNLIESHRIDTEIAVFRTASQQRLRLSARF